MTQGLHICRTGRAIDDEVFMQHLQDMSATRAQQRL